jgi:hypothetical protein
MTNNMKDRKPRVTRKEARATGQTSTRTERIIARNEAKQPKLYARADKKIETGYAKSPAKGAKMEAKHGYNMPLAKKSGATADATGHWPSLNPATGQVLKGTKHPSMPITRATERDMGNKIVKKKGAMYSVPMKKKK